MTSDYWTTLGNLELVDALQGREGTTSANAKEALPAAIAREVDMIWLIIDWSWWQLLIDLSLPAAIVREVDMIQLLTDWSWLIILIDL